MNGPMSKRLRADLSLAFCSFLWGATFVVVKNALDHASVFIFLAVRFTLTVVLMLALVTGFSADSNEKISSRVCGSAASCFWDARFRPRACSTRRLQNPASSPARASARKNKN